MLSRFLGQWLVPKDTHTRTRTHAHPHNTQAAAPPAEDMDPEETQLGGLENTFRGVRGAEALVPLQQAAEDAARADALPFEYSAGSASQESPSKRRKLSCPAS